MSTNPSGRQTGLTTTPIVAAAIGTKIFSKIAASSAAPDVASEPGDVLRIVKNTHATVTAYLGETQAKSVDVALSYPLGPGEAITILGPSGFGWGGDLYAASAGGAVSIGIIKA